MPVEVAKLVDDFNKFWPRGTDPVSKADDHIRMIKEVLQLEFELLYNKTRVFSFEEGAVVNPDCILYYETEKAFYQWNGTYDVNNEYVVNAGSTPTTAGGIGGNAWTRSTGSGFMSTVLVSDTEPTAPFQNMLWWDTNSGTFFIHYNDGTSTQWVDLFGIADQSTFNTLLFRSILARLAAESGYTLVGGSFQEGAVSSGSSDVVLDWNTAKFYQWHLNENKVVPAGSTPATSGGIGAGAWVDRTDDTLRASLKARLTTDESNITSLLTMTSAQHQLTGASIAKQLADGGSPIFACYGDSTMWGATVENLNVQNPNNPPAKLAFALNLLYGGTYTVTNRGISGTTLHDMLLGTDGSGSTFLTKISAGGIDAAANVIICNHGINDSQLNYNIDTYRDDLITFIKLCRTAGKVPVLATPNPNPHFAIISEVKGKRLLNYVKMMRTVAGIFGVDLVDQYAFLDATAKMVPMTTLIPDGAHPSSAVYKQNGFNLAIPFICAKTIGHDFDSAGMDGVTYYDNMKSSRSVKIQGRGGVNISANREGELTGINYPVILKEPRQVVSFIGLQWNSAAQCVLDKNSDNAVAIHYAQRQFGLISLLDWDSEMKFYGNFYAGLNIMQLMFNLGTPGLGNGLTFGGIYLPPRYITCASGSQGYLQHNNRIATYDEVIASNVFFDNNANFELTDTGGNTVLKIIFASGTVTASLYANGVAVQTQTIVASGLPSGNYNVSVSSTPTTVEVTFSSVATVFTITTPLPNMRVKTKLINYTIAPRNGVVNGW